MNKNESKNKLTELTSKVSGWIVGFTSLVTALVGFVKLWQGNRGLVTVILILCGVGGLILIFSYLSFKKNPPRKENDSTQWVFPRLRPFAITGLISILLISLVGFSYWIYSCYRVPDKVIVLVADFFGPEPQKWAITEKILENLDEALSDEPKAQLKALGQVITQKEGNERARRIGKKHKALIVIWGWYAVTEQSCYLSMHFEVLRKIKGFPKIKIEPHITEISELQNFSLQTKLSQKLTFLTLFTVGLIHYYASYYNYAKQSFTQALEEKTEILGLIDLAIPYIYRGNTHFFLKEYDHAITDYSKTLELYPKEAKIFYNRGNAYYEINDFEHAIADYTKAIELDSKDTKVLNNRGNAYHKKKDFKHAIADYTKVLELVPKNATAFYNRGLAYYEIKNFDHAIADFNKAFELNPKYIKTLFDRGNTYYELKDFDRAIADYTKVLELDPKYTSAYFIRGLIYYNLKNFKHVVADFNKVLELNPKYPTAYFIRGLAYFNLKDFERAIVNYTKSLELEPKLAQALNSRGLAYTKLRDFEHAIADYTKALELDPKDKITQMNLTEALIIVGKTEDAEQSARKVLKLAQQAEDRAIGHYMLALSLKLQGKKTEEVDAKLDLLCVEMFETTWSFNEIEDWLTEADIPKESKNYIREKTEMLKKHRSK